MIGSLCTGYAGLDMAAHALTGQDTAFVADVDAGANLILEHRLPQVPNIGDLTTYDFTPWAGIVRTLTAGYPCQPFSHAGNRKGVNDPRHLFPHVARSISEIRPELVLLENVRGHLRLGFDEVLGTLATIGYDARWIVVSASQVGAPHERARLYVAAYPHSDGHGPRTHPRIVGRVDPGHEGQTRQRQRARSLPVRRGPQAPPDTNHPGRREQRRTIPAPTQHTPAQHRRQAPAFGPYAPAVARWATLTRPAPSPTVGGRLAPAFVEWMMGLPAGWVTDTPGLAPNAQLKALGNGVVPQAALAAYRAMGVAA